MPQSAICHPDRPSAGRGMCKRCYSTDWKRRNLGTQPLPPPGVPTCGHPDRRIQGNGMCGYCYRKQWVESQGSDYEASRRLKFKFGMSLERYTDLLNDQGRVCKICRLPERRDRLIGMEEYQ